ncbi:MAG: N-6 DNA methylase [Isosphaeraceae bacterium]|jgi:hypothetical protein
MDENPGEHFTPREVVRLMAALILSHDHEALHQAGIVRTVSDPCSGTGGMLTLGKDRILEINPQAQVHLFGQEVNPETYAVCKSDLYMKSLDGKDAENIKFGSTLARDAHGGLRFDYQLANPPYGKEWKIDQKGVEAEYERGHAGRFGAGLPRISDGQLLFLCHMLNRMKPKEEGGGRVAIVMNGSPLIHWGRRIGGVGGLTNSPRVPSAPSASSKNVASPWSHPPSPARSTSEGMWTNGHLRDHRRPDPQDPRDDLQLGWRAGGERILLCRYHEPGSGR